MEGEAVMDPKDLVFTSLGFRMGTQTTYFPSCGCTWAGEEKYCPVPYYNFE